MFNMDGLKKESLKFLNWIIVYQRNSIEICKKGAITMDENKKEVYFGEFCDKCKYSNKREDEEPCWDCLDQPWNTNSHKPMYFEKK